jgi:hypothetical protein
MEEARAQCSFDDKHLNHHCGPCPALAAGVSFGGGQHWPGNLAHNGPNHNILQRLACHPSFICASNLVNGAFATWFHKMYKYYHTTLGLLYEHDKGLKRPFPRSVWAAMSFNLGPVTICYWHTDWGNLTYGVCIITSSGKFDLMLDGHLILWECSLVIQFPPGASIIIPSAIISHLNIPIQPHETQYLFTQYAASGLFRWVEHGFQKEENYVNAFFILFYFIFKINNL